jgi:hypothetical protein
MPRLAQKTHRPLPWWSSLLVTAAIFTWALTMLLIGIENARKGTELQELQIVERSVNRAVVTCYAMEGFYPPSIDYLIENYGLEVDLNKYYIYQEAFAPNVYPTIWVVRR